MRRRTPLLAIWAHGLILISMVGPLGVSAWAQRAVYLQEIRRAAEKGWRDNPGVIERWKATSAPNILWGYDAPAHPIYLAATLAFLFENSGERQYAQRTAALLESYGDLRDALPEGFAKTRAEYADGVPALSNFFFLPPYARAYMRIRSSDVLSPSQRKKIERDLAQSVDFVFRFPEWGGHNRAMLRAEALLYASLALPEHPRAAAWRQMARNIAMDNIGHWEIEDASNYSPVWLHALCSYAEASGRNDAFTSVPFRYALEYFARLIGPSGTIPDFGDAAWNSASGGLRMVAFFEKGAAVYRNPEWKWAAASVFATARRDTSALGVGEAYHLADAYHWADDGLPAQKPVGLSQEVLDDVIGKKVVFRNGWESGSTYLLLNYRDEGEGGLLDRSYLRNTISVEEEKMHHGHADENSIVQLMDHGSLLLHDAGYRDGLPSGPFGAWRQDYYHNRVVVRLNKRDASQSPLAYAQNSGAYRPVKTSKVDFLATKDADMSRTRVEDEALGYRWDRSVVYLKEPGCFVVVDGVKFLRSDYYTVTNFWHAGSVLARGPHWVDIATDTLPGYGFSRERSLRVLFADTSGKSETLEPISRHGMRETALSQSIASHYRAGDYEVFVTLLVSHPRAGGSAAALPTVRILPVSTPSRAFALELAMGPNRWTVFSRIDLEMELARENIRPRYLYDLGKVSFGDFETDGYFLCAREAQGVLRYACSNFLRLVHRGKTLVGALPNTHALQLDGSPPRVGYSKWRLWEDQVTIGN